MSEAILQTEIVTPQKLTYSVAADEVVIPGIEGDLGVLKDHIPLITILKPGVITIFANNDKVKFFVEGGFAEVSDNRCTVLAKEATNLKDISRQEAENRLKAAQEAIAKAQEEEIKELEEELHIAEQSIEAIDTHFNGS